jgi:hypothetical protein
MVGATTSEIDGWALSRNEGKSDSAIRSFELRSETRLAVVMMKLGDGNTVVGAEVAKDRRINAGDTSGHLGGGQGRRGSRGR